VSATDPYRTLAHARCDNCDALEQEIRRLDGSAVGIQPFPKDVQPDAYPDWTHIVICPFCTQRNGVFWRERSDYSGPHRELVVVYRDRRICIGQRHGFFWLLKCAVAVPHRHRVCQNCERTWIEHARPEGWKP
jgi:hypothetical protein